MGNGFVSGFGPGEGEAPTPPVDIPVPPGVPPDLYKILFGVYAQVQSSMLNNQGVPKYLAWIPDVILWIIQSLLAQILNVITALLLLVFRVFNSTDASMNQLAAAAVQGMTGVSASAGQFGSVIDRDSRTGLARGIATLFSSALRGSVTTQSDGTIAPTDESANKFMEMAAHMAIEGWLQGWIVELCTWDKAERFADLKDTLENVLGIGRLSRRAMAAPMKVLVEDPYTALMNQTYHPTRLNSGEAVRSYLRGKINRTELQALMNLDGYVSGLVDDLIWDQIKPLGPPEILELLVNGQMQTADAITALQRGGYDQTGAAQVLQVVSKNRTDAWERKGCEEALALYRGKKIARADYDDVVNRTRLPSDEQQFWHGLATINDYSSRTRLDMARGEELYRKGIWDVLQFEDLATIHGYSPEDIASLDALVRLEIQADKDAAAAKAAAALRRQLADQKRQAAEQARLAKAQFEIESKGVSVAQYETLVEDGLRTYAQYHDYLIRREVAPDNADALVVALQTKIKQKADAAAAKAAKLAAAQIKHIDVAQLEKAFKEGLLMAPEFTAALVGRGMPLADAVLVTAEVQGQIDTAAGKAKATAAAKAQAAIKHVDLTQEERAVRLGIETIDQFSAFLDAHGFEPHDRDVLVSELNAQLATDKQTAAKKAAAAAKLATKGISLSQLERLVRAGVKTPADYTAALAAAGYDQADQQAMAQFLQLQMDQDQQDLILHGHAAALVDQLGVSLADLERAVKLSVVPIATYQDALNRAGLSKDDQTTLVNNLVAQVKATRARQTTMQSVSKQVAAAGVTLASLEKDTVSGKISVAQFSGLLAGYGVSDTDVADVVQLVQDEIDNAKAVAALVAQAGARAAAKGLDLAQDTAAFKQGVMTEDQWRARVASLGYDAADVEILFETLAAAQAETAAKSAKKTTTTATTSATPAAGATAGG